MNQHSQHILTCRIARNDHDVEAAQRLRHEVFFKDRNRSLLHGQDRDHYDDACDHLLVEAHNSGRPKLVGTYRLLRRDVAEGFTGFYTQNEFDVDALLQRKPGLRALELGRSCVHREYRSRAVINALWQGIWDYVREYKIELMFGCASFEGTDATQHSAALGLLAQYAAAPEEWNVRAHPQNAVPMSSQSSLELKQTLRDMPPLIRAYLNLGCYIGEGAVIDHDFGTTDVLIILPVSRINPRFFARFGSPAEIP